MNPLITIALILLAYMTTWFVISLILRRNDVADIAWGLGFILVAWSAYALLGGTNLGFIVNCLVTMWGIRLATHIYIRNRNKTEDHRYQAWRREWGKLFYLRSYLQIYMLQGALLLLVATPVIFANSTTADINLVTLLGIGIWCVGFFFESVGDYQLMIFKNQAQSKDQVMQTGLWNYTRHPNYFGEVTLWWGIYLTVITAPNGILTIIGPLTITYLILGLSGVPMLERRYVGNVKYDDYKKRVSAFFPLPPRNL